MALDHYIPQVYLRQWNSISRDGKQVLVTRKKDLREFPANPKSICRIDDGNTNLYFEDPRLIEVFLRDIEPFYNQAVESFRNASITKNEVYVIAGMISYISSCSPTAVRLGSEMLQGLVKAEISLLDRGGAFPRPPEELGEDSITSLVDTGKVIITVNESYPQSLGIDIVLDLISYLVDTNWQVLRITSGADRFLTSDFPTAVLIPNRGQPVTRVFPLSPDLAVVVKGRNQPIKSGARSIDFQNFRYKYISPSPQMIRDFNDLIVKSADSLVVSNSRPDWLKGFIRKRSAYRLKNVVERVASTTGATVLTTLQYVSD